MTKQNIYTVKYEYDYNGHTGHTIWCGRAESSEDAISKSTKWYEFEKTGAVVTDVKVSVFKPSPNQLEEIRRMHDGI